MATVSDYELSYTTRTWKVYRLPWQSESHPVTIRDSILQFCNSSSEMARRLGNSPNRFYVDYELIMADLDPLAGGGEPERLTTEWTAPDSTVYPIGTLVMQPFCGVHGNDPAAWTRIICIEVPA